MNATTTPGSISSENPDPDYNFVAQLAHEINTGCLELSCVDKPSPTD